MLMLYTDYLIPLHAVRQGLFLFILWVRGLKLEEVPEFPSVIGNVTGSSWQIHGGEAGPRGSRPCTALRTWEINHDHLLCVSHTPR